MHNNKVQFTVKSYLMKGYEKDFKPLNMIAQDRKSIGSGNERQKKNDRTASINQNCKKKSNLHRTFITIQ